MFTSGSTFWDSAAKVLRSWIGMAPSVTNTPETQPLNLAPPGWIAGSPRGAWR